MRVVILSALAFACLALSSRTAVAWIYPEHRQIGVVAWSRLPADGRAFYEALWQQARVNLPGLCEAPSAGLDWGGDCTPCIDYPAWPAIAGDHSCSPDELIENVLPSAWIYDVARVSEKVRRDLAGAPDKSSRLNVWIASNLRLQEVDDAYVTRAGANNAHFLLPHRGTSLAEFLTKSTESGAPLNAMGLYVQYHAAAMRLASTLGAHPTHSDIGTVRRVLALEAYALHFLQDMFSSGHVAGTWGDAATRKGTHDYYCEHGYSANSWSGRELIMYGDAHMRDADIARGAEAMSASMMQVFQAAREAKEGGAATSTADPRALSFAALDSCVQLTHPATIAIDERTQKEVEALLARTPVPGYDADSVAWPRYRSDFGPFIGLKSHLSVGSALGGFGGGSSRAVSEFGLGLRVGYGLEGVVGALDSGTMYLQAGLVRQSDQQDICVEDCSLGVGSAALPRVPSRAGLALQLRLPFWAIPGDLLVLAPVLAVASPNDLKRVAIRAASGGLIPWQRTFSTSIGSFEVVAGRLVGVTFHGLSRRDRVIAYATGPSTGETELVQVGFRSVSLLFPAIEYTPFRAFAQTLTAALKLQLAYAVDVPVDTIIYGTAAYSSAQPGVDWSPAHMILLRLSVSGRNYL